MPFGSSVDQPRLISPSSDPAIDFEESFEVAIIHVIVLTTCQRRCIFDRLSFDIVSERDSVDDDVILVGKVGVVVDRVDGILAGRLGLVRFAIGHQDHHLLDWITKRIISLVGDQFFDSDAHPSTNTRGRGIQVGNQLRNSGSHRLKV